MWALVIWEEANWLLRSFLGDMPCLMYDSYHEVRGVCHEWKGFLYISNEVISSCLLSCIKIHLKISSPIRHLA